MNKNNNDILFYHQVRSINKNNTNKNKNVKDIFLKHQVGNNKNKNINDIFPKHQVE